MNFLSEEKKVPLTVEKLQDGHIPIKTGLVGWRGMVGSVLIERMKAENDFENIDAVFFSTSQAGQALETSIAKLATKQSALQDANDIDRLREMDIVVTCQGGQYTNSVYPKLRKSGWKGYWIDASSALRQAEDTMICLDPVNGDALKAGLKRGVKTFAGANCTTAVMLMALNGLFTNKLIKWVSLMSYQAISGAGAKAMDELLLQMQAISQNNNHLQGKDFLSRQKLLNDGLLDDKFPKTTIGFPLASNLLPWIDSELENGQSREEMKTMSETNKILALENDPIPIDGLCVRVPTLRCHSKGFTIALHKDLSVEEIEKIITKGSQWVKVVPNHKEETLRKLTPAAVAGSLDIHIGRIRKMNIDSQMISAFAVGDQLLWGAAEPLRRMLKIVANHWQTLLKTPIKTTS